MGMAALMMPAEVFSDVVRLVVGARTYNSLATYIPDASSVEHRDFRRRVKSPLWGFPTGCADSVGGRWGLERGATRSMLSHATG